MASSNPIYDRQHRLLQIGRWSLNTEVQVLLDDGGTSDWFDEPMLQNVLKILCTPFEERFESGGESTDFDVIEKDDLYIVYKFQRQGKGHKRDTYLTHLPKQVIKPGAARESYGKFKPCYLRNEKLIITVAKQCLPAGFVVEKSGLNVAEQRHSVSTCLKPSKETDPDRKKFDNRKPSNEKSVTVSDIDVVEPLTVQEKCIASGGDVDKSFHTIVNKFHRDQQHRIKIDNIVEGKRRRKADNKIDELPPATDSSNRDYENVQNKDQKQKRTLANCRNQILKEIEKESDQNQNTKEKDVDINLLLRSCPKKKGINNIENTKSSAKKKSVVGKGNRTSKSKQHKDESILELAVEEQTNVRCATKHLIKSTTNKETVGNNSVSAKETGAMSFTTNKETVGNNSVSAKETGTMSLTQNNSDTDEFAEAPIRNTKSRKRKRNKITFPVKKRFVNKERSNSSAGSHFSLEELVRNKESDLQGCGEVIEERVATPKMPTLDDDVIDLDDYGKVDVDQLSDIAELNMTQLRNIVRSLEKDIRSIFEGKVYCRRHEQYKRGGMERDGLSMQISFGEFSEDHGEVVTKVLREMFCKRKTTYFDYVMKVLLPETLLMVYEVVCRCTKEEAIRAFSH